MKTFNTAVRSAACAAVIGLAGCATPYQPIPQGYAGPKANLADSIKPRTGSLAEFYAVVEIDGKSITNTFGATAAANQGKGFSLTPNVVDRDLPAAPVKIKLRASHVTGAPIQAMAMQMAGTYASVDGVVDFVPEPSKRYVVTGILQKEGSSVWIEDMDTKQAVTARIKSK